MAAGGRAGAEAPLLCGATTVKPRVPREEGGFWQQPYHSSGSAGAIGDKAAAVVHPLPVMGCRSSEHKSSSSAEESQPGGRPTVGDVVAVNGRLGRIEKDAVSMCRPYVVKFEDNGENSSWLHESSVKNAEAEVVRLYRRRHPISRHGRPFMPAPLLPTRQLQAPPCPPTPQMQPPPRPERPPELYVVDNALFILTVLIAARDLLWLCQRDPSTPGLYGDAMHYASLTFLMPTYAVLAGYLAAADLRMASRKLHGIVKAGATYAMAQLLYLMLLHYAQPWLSSFRAGARLLKLGERNLREDRHCSWDCWLMRSFGIPYHHLWYLLYVFGWRLLLLLWSACSRAPLLAAWVFGAAFPCFKLDRSLPPLLPFEGIVASFIFFLLGSEAEERGWKLWSHRWSRLAGLGAVLAFAWLPWAMLEAHAGQSMVAETWGWQGSMDTWNGVVGDDARGRALKTLLRMAATLAQAISAWGVFHLMPRKELTVITRAGRRSLADYIFHILGALPISFAANFGPLGSIAALWPGQLLTCFLAMAASVVWTSESAWKVLSLVVNPPVHRYLGSLTWRRTLPSPRTRLDSELSLVELQLSPRQRWQQPAGPATAAAPDARSPATASIRSVVL